MTKRARPTQKKNGPPLWLAAVLALVAALLSTVYVLRDSLSLSETTVTSGSRGLLVGIEETGEIEVMRRITRTVFPHDYLSADLTVSQLLRKISAAGTTAEAALAPGELRHFNAANLASAVGLSTTREGDRYVVITTEMTWGYRISPLRSALEQQLAEVDAVSNEVQTRQLRLPEPEVLRRRTEDITRQTYPYGDVPLNADGLRRVSEFIGADVVVGTSVDEMRAEAQSAALDLMHTLLATNQRGISLVIATAESP